MNNTNSDNAQSDGPAFSYPQVLKQTYVEAHPFPHITLTGTWDGDLLASCKQEISDFQGWEGEKDFYGARKKRYCSDIEALPASVARVIREANSPQFIQWLEAVTGEQELKPDWSLEGGGIHQIKAGGFLKIHSDFNWNKRIRLYRRLNVLIYLNANWDPTWGGAIEFWNSDLSHCEQAVYPELNTMVIFTTDDHSFHGHPHPLAAPEQVTRDSIALYYYSAKRPPSNHLRRRKSTDYRPIAGDGFERVTLLSKIKDRAKRLFGLEKQE